MNTQVLLDRLIHGPIGRQIAEEEAAKNLALRQAAAAELARIEAGLAKAVPSLLKAENVALDEVRKVEAALKAAQAKHTSARTARIHAVNSSEMAANRQRAILRELAPVGLLTEFREELEALRESIAARTKAAVPDVEILYKEQADAVRRAVAINTAKRRAIEAANDAIRAVAQDEQWILTALPEDQLRVKFEALKAAILSAGEA